MLVSDHNSYDGYRNGEIPSKERIIQISCVKGVEYDTIDCGHMW